MAGPRTPPLRKSRSRPDEPNRKMNADAILDSLTEAVAVLNKTGLLLSANTAWKRLARDKSGPVPPMSVGGNYFQACRKMPGESGERARRALHGIQTVLGGSSQEFHVEYPCRIDKKLRWFLLRANPLSHPQGGVVLSHVDISAQKQTQQEQERHIKDLEIKNQELDQMAIRDPLTGLYNRRFFDEMLAREWRRFQRSGEPFTLIIMDMDGFKGINDRYGHETGDRALQQAATGLRQNLRESDLVARVGGDEFAALLPRTDTDRSRPVIDKLREIIGKLRLTSQAGTIPLSLSLGTATVPGVPPVTSAAELLRVADKRMYEAKRLHSAGKPHAR